MTPYTALSRLAALVEHYRYDDAQAFLPAVHDVLRLPTRQRKGCKVDGCDRLHEARGLCALHYKHWREGRLDEGRACGCPRTTGHLSVCALVRAGLRQEGAS